MSAATKRPPQPHPQPHPHQAPQPQPQQAQPSLWLLMGGGRTSGWGGGADEERTRDAQAAYGALADTTSPQSQMARSDLSRGGLGSLGDGGLGSLGFDPYAWAREQRFLSAAEERRLTKQMRAGDSAARERLFASQARWALTLARWHATVRAPLDDLAQIAWMTLWRELPNHEPARGRLTTYIAPYVLRDVRRAVNELSGLIRRPQGVVDAERREWRFYARYEAEHGVEPSAELAAAALDAPPQVVSRMRLAARHRPIVVSLDTPQRAQAGRHGGGHTHTFATTYAETVASEDAAVDPVEASARAERSQIVATFVAHAGLTHMEQQVIALLYCDDRRLSESRGETNSGERVARVLGVSRERVRQLHQRALTKLRQANTRSGGRLSELYAEMAD